MNVLLNKRFKFFESLKLWAAANEATLSEHSFLEWQRCRVLIRPEVVSRQTPILIFFGFFDGGKAVLCKSDDGFGKTLRVLFGVLGVTKISSQFDLDRVHYSTIHASISPGDVASGELRVLRCARVKHGIDFEIVFLELAK